MHWKSAHRANPRSRAVRDPRKARQRPRRGAFGRNQAPSKRHRKPTTVAAKPRTPLVRIVSWNVNGLRACATKGFGRFLETSKADVIGVQEVRAFPEQLDERTRAPRGWYAYFACGERA